ncbi:hypothetical protein [Clostridium sp. OS1-26]|uniref:hypothetical protein n=1 Tax=Clostridium sp. OS1-26 TaxID=3070681 RepID=UPI0027E1A1C7|nr:hypothetical protein [Clostridium sp. OS1-26]WML34830.1 hypothetical protein RCG18_26860 [Clostridium sp. OS1-26]
MQNIKERVESALIKAGEVLSTSIMNKNMIEENRSYFCNFLIMLYVNICFYLKLYVAVFLLSN